VLNRQCRLLFVNRAWEEWTGVSAAEARGLACTRRGAENAARGQIVARSLWPPAEALQGRPAHARRRVEGLAAGKLGWWDIEFFPLHGEDGLLCILGKLSGAPLAPVAGAVAFPEALQALRSHVARKLSKDEAAKLWKVENLIALRERWAGRFRLDHLASELPAMQRVADQARLASRTRACVLFVGETGSGKAWLARAIHHGSDARERAFAGIDCARLPAAALAEALFGSASLARRPGMGTLYLREPSLLPQDLQLRLHDWLEQAMSEPEAAGPRIIAGCRVDPFAEVRAGRLLEKLHAVLATLVIELPPLRARMADLPSLVDRMLERVNETGEKHPLGLTPAAWALLREYPWPGNLRELHAVLVDAHARTDAEQIDVANLPAYLRQTVQLDQTTAASPERPMPLDSLLEQAERRLIQVALQRARGNKSRAAELLAVWRPRLLRRMEALGLDQESGIRGQESGVRNQESEDVGDS
jgi:DNA-binding NtrC family response regulator